MKTTWLARLLALAIAAACAPAAAGPATSPPADAAGGAAPVAVRVDPRVELISIIFRLAEVPGYTMTQFPGYVDDIHAHFGAFRDHPAVALARRAADSSGVSWDAPMGLAVHLTPLPQLASRMPLRQSALDPRWPPEGAEEFAAAAGDFAEVADFGRFYDRHRPLYSLAESRMAQTLREHADLAWFPRFFRQRAESPFTVLLGLSNGGASYYTRFAAADGPEEIYAVIGAWQVDEAGLPRFGEEVVGTVAHELAHAYVNPWVDAHRDALRAPGEAVYEAVRGPMQAQFYGRWDLAVKESLVRATVARYTLSRRGAAAASRELAAELERGFLWVDELNAVLGMYERAPGLYPSFARFSPGLAAYFQDLAPRAADLAARYDARRPRIVAMSVPTGATGVDPTLTEITFHFDRVMDRRHHPLVTQGDSGQAHYPGAAEARFDSAGLVLTLPVRLRPDWSYRFTLGYPSGGGFVDTHGVSMKPVEVWFSTGPARP